jgi:hypothetical protein
LILYSSNATFLGETVYRLTLNNVPVTGWMFPGVQTTAFTTGVGTTTSAITLSLPMVIIVHFDGIQCLNAQPASQSLWGLVGVGSPPIPFTLPR